MEKYVKGIFKPRNPQKYKGNPTNIIYRSSWELKMMSHFDGHPNIIWWQSEEVIVPYRSPIDNKIHRYYPDFLVNLKNKEGILQTIMIEVKPKNQSIPPMLKEGQTTKNKKYIREVILWGKNEAKWKAAQEYCKDRGWSFQVFTEEQIGIK
jgi:hypothetical protein